MFKRMWFRIRCFWTRYCPKHNWDYDTLGGCDGCRKDATEARLGQCARLKEEYEELNGA